MEQRMFSDDFIRFLRENGHLKKIEDLPMSDAMKEELKKKSTTIISVLAKDCVYLGGDRQATSIGDGYASYFPFPVDKVCALDDYTAVGISGTMFFCIIFMEAMQLDFETQRKLNRSKPLGFAEKIARVKNFLRENMGAAFHGIVVMPLVVGYDEEGKNFKMIWFDPFGTQFDKTADGVTATGSGMDVVLKALRTDKDLTKWKPSLSERKDSLERMLYLFHRAKEEDVGSGFKSERGSYPLVIEITKEGSRMLPEEEVEAAYNEMRKTMLER